MSWRRLAHEYLVQKFLASPGFHRLVRRLNGEGYQASHNPRFADFERLREEEKLVRARKRRMFWQLFKEEMRYEIFPYRRK